ncbi:hypothetical protein IW261DRAFT_1419586 [Armillaria novae-zelandiae]|uniref:Uncharacterized protein n=1 Tax=Armillaria novae-zelandiae TaxID=153914 RepID=A0AA39PB53_9AGAR|nr:hypothetical protein IW261DRAFT_1421694 [Armillaria novae-zelandiae]KAK0480394.1 hypothetical protein IW261DRAFT_1419586 [Armillaria novae-zelandiae]
MTLVGHMTLCKVLGSKSTFANLKDVLVVSLWERFHGVNAYKTNEFQESIFKEPLQRQKTVERTQAVEPVPEYTFFAGLRLPSAKFLNPKGIWETTYLALVRSIVLVPGLGYRPGLANPFALFKDTSTSQQIEMEFCKGPQDCVFNSTLGCAVDRCRPEGIRRFQSFSIKPSWMAKNHHGMLNVLISISAGNGIDQCCMGLFSLSNVARPRLLHIHSAHPDAPTIDLGKACYNLRWPSLRHHHCNHTGGYCTSIRKVRRWMLSVMFGPLPILQRDGLEANKCSFREKHNTALFFYTGSDVTPTSALTTSPAFHLTVRNSHPPEIKPSQVRIESPMTAR